MMKGFAAEAIPTIIGGEKRLCDIGLNLLDDMFIGVYNGKQRHKSDILDVLLRAQSVGVTDSIITSGNVEESRNTLELISKIKSEHREELSACNLFMTVGVHPTRCNEFKRGEHLVVSELSDVIERGVAAGYVMAVGECGLDYDRLQFCEKDQQTRGFLRHFELAKKYNLPMFLHDRNTSGDFARILAEHRDSMPRGGVVHSFTGSQVDLEALTALGMFIGVNGCSLKTEENLEVVRRIPLELLLLETDAPWCGIKNTHASKPFVRTEFLSKKKEKFEAGFLVKDRAEPCMMVQVLEVVAALKEIDPDQLASVVWDNTQRLFGLPDSPEHVKG